VTYANASCLPPHKTCRVTTLAAMHDLTLAAAYCDRVYVLREGSLVAGGLPADILSAPVLKQVFEVDVTVIAYPRTGKPHLVFDSLDRSGQESGQREGESSAAENHTGPDLPQRKWV
jgi:ABC-type glutathione transport system ATPase component